MQGFCLSVFKTFALPMIKTDPNQTEFVNFYLPFGGKLQASNRWVKLATKMPWQEVERCYTESFAGTGMGAPAKSGRIAYGALVIREQLGVSDEETVGQISENPYLQYFPGLHEFRQTALFRTNRIKSRRRTQESYRWMPPAHRRTSVIPPT